MPSRPVSIEAALDQLTFLPDRTPATTEVDWARAVADYRDGAIFVAHYAGSSEWERHPADEIVMVLEGDTTLTLLVDGEDHPNHLSAHEFLVVPAGVWHRFDTPQMVKVFSVTPQPTDHQAERPTS